MESTTENETKTGKKSKQIKLLPDFLLADEAEPAHIALKIIRKIVRTIIGAVQKFMGDEGILRAASISYSVIVSFIPTVIVVFLVGNRFFDFDRYKIIIREFIRKNDLPFQPDPYFEVFDQLLLNADAITGIALIVILFSATAVLRNLENALNRVWKVKKSRPWMQKIAGFLFVLILGPALLTVGLSTGQSYVRKAAPPDILQIQLEQNKPVVLGSQGLYIKKEETQWTSAFKLTTIDFEAQKEPTLINEENNRLLSPEEVDAVRSVLGKIDKTKESDISSTSIRDTAKAGEKVWVVTENGNILFSKDGGKNWSVQRYLIEKMKLLFAVRFRKIVMVNEETGFILGTSGLILNTNDGGDTWNPSYLENVTTNFNDVEKISANTYIAVGDDFTILRSKDAGKTWRSMNATVKAGKTKENPDLLDVFSIKSHIWIAGDMGTILHSTDYGRSWDQKDLGLHNIDFRTIAFKNVANGIVAGEAGTIRETNDGGATWKKVTGSFRTNLNHALFDATNDRLWIAGEGYYLYEISGNQFSKAKKILKPAFWRKIFVALGDIVLPFFAIWSIFFLIYKIMPYTDVSNRAGAWGAFATSVLWVTFLLVYKSYAGLFTKGQLAIYGTLAAIPVTLILVYISAAIIVFGAEIGYYIQFPDTLRLGHRKIGIEIEKRQIWYAFRFLQVLYENFHKGNGATKESALIKACNNDVDDYKLLMGNFIELEIVEKTEKGHYLPAKGAETLFLKNLIEIIDPVDFRVPSMSGKDGYYKELGTYFSKMKKNRSEIFEETTIADLLQTNK
ncbi:MAG: YhjD/YihY/BrkB family envelope integrity protein [Leptospirales bacterium]